MKSQYIVEKKNDYLYMDLSGQYDIDTFMTYPKIVAEQCAKEKINKVLVNGLNVKGTNVPTMDRFFVGETIARYLGSKIKLAVAWPGEHIDKFAETVAVNRGAMVLVVGDVETAEKWLLEDS